MERRIRRAEKDSNSTDTMIVTKIKTKEKQQQPVAQKVVKKEKQQQTVAQKVVKKESTKVNTPELHKIETVKLDAAQKIKKTVINYDKSTVNTVNAQIIASIAQNIKLIKKPFIQTKSVLKNQELNTQSIQSDEAALPSDYTDIGILSEGQNTDNKIEVKIV